MPPKKAAKKPAAKAAAKKPAAKPTPKKATPEKPAPKTAAKRKAGDDGAAPAAKKAAKAKPKVDHLFHGGGEVYQEDGVNYAVTLNQTNIGQNNNKFYVIQVIQQAGKYVGFTRWGRVGEPGQQASQSFPNAEGAKGLFKSKFKDKTKNAWDKVMNDHSAFVSAPGKYDLVETAIEEETPTPEAAPAGKAVKQKACTLGKELQEMLTTVFDKDMFKKQMEKMGMDPSKIPLGKLTKSQVQRGYEALEAIEEAVEKKKTKDLDRLCSTFYTHIPHNFGRSVPPLIKDADTIQKKYDLLNVLADIEVAQQTEKAAGAKADAHPMDAQYKELGTGLSYVDPKSAEFKWIQKYTEQTAGGWRKATIKHAFRVDRKQDKERMNKFKKLDNRKMLWHGTNVAVVAAILKTGLRIMPHAGGRVGSGLYFASENSKSAGYTSTDQNNHGFMFLNEVALGTSKEIDKDDHTLNKKKVETYKVDSIIARGRTEPDPSKDITIDGEWGKITVPQGKALPQSKWNGSRFSQTEYLVYDEGQVRIKYILMMKF